MTFIDVINKYNYTFKNNVLLFQRGFLSCWFGAFKDQSSPIIMSVEDKFDDFNHKFNCAEQGVMCYKATLFRDWGMRDKILDEKHPRQQQLLGRQVKNFHQKTWDDHKERIYYDVILEKFRQNEHLREELLCIPKFVIFCESAYWDKTWGSGLAPDHPDAADVTKWPGLNLLGKTLMRVKEKLDGGPGWW